MTELVPVNCFVRGFLLFSYQRARLVDQWHVIDNNRTRVLARRLKDRAKKSFDQIHGEKLVKQKKKKKLNEGSNNKPRIKKRENFTKSRKINVKWLNTTAKQQQSKCVLSKGTSCKHSLCNSVSRPSSAFKSFILNCNSPLEIRKCYRKFDSLVRARLKTKQTKTRNV